MSIIKLNAIKLENGGYTKDGVKRMAYYVQGNAKDLAFYKEQKGAFYSEIKEGPHAGKPLFTSKRDACVADVLPLKYIEEYDVKFVIDSEQWELDTMRSLKMMKLAGYTPQEIFASQQTSLFPETVTETPVAEDTAEDIGNL